MRRRLLLAAAMIACGSKASAQTNTEPGTVPAEIGVADRPRPEYDPIGGRIGSFFLYPSITVSTEATDNLLATRSNKVSDLLFHIRPEVSLQSDWQRHYLRLNGYYAKDFHLRRSSEDFTQYGANAAGRLDFAEDFHAGLNASVSRLAESRADINSTSATRSPIRFTQEQVSASATKDFAALSFTVQGGLTHQNFDNGIANNGTVVVQDFRDNSYYTGLISGRYQWSPSISLVGQVGVDKINYTNDSVTGFNRDSTGLRAEGGVGLELTSLIYGDVRVGYLSRHNDDARLLDTSGLSFSANVLWNVTPLTSLRFFADRTIEPGGSPVTAGNVRSTFSVTADHELLRNLVLTGYARYAAISPQGPLSGAHEYEGQLSARYYINRRFQATANYHLIGRSSASFGGFHENSATIGLTVKF